MSRIKHYSKSVTTSYLVFFSLAMGFVPLISRGDTTADSHVGGAPSAGQRPETGRKLPLISGKPYFRYGLLKDHFSGTLGRCSATGIDMKDLGVSTEKLGQGCIQLALTAKHCIEDAAKGLSDEIAEDRSKLDHLMCDGKGFKGIKTQLDLSLPQGRTDAILIQPLDSTSASDLALIALPCGQGIQAFKLADQNDSAPKQMEVWRPYSAQARGLSESVPVRRDLERRGTIGNQSVKVATHDSKSGLYTFDDASNTQQGDSGSPGFIGSGPDKKLAAVLHGVGGGDPLAGGILMAAGLKLNGDNPAANADLKSDVKKMVESMDCGGYLNGKKDSTQVADASTPDGQPSGEQGRRGLADFKPGKPPGAKAQEIEQASAQAPKGVASTGAPQTQQPQPERKIAAQPATQPSAQASQAGGYCDPKTGICHKGPGVEGIEGLESSPFSPGEQKAGPLETAPEIGSPHSTTATPGFKEVQVSDRNEFRQALEQAKQDGVKHVVVRYGNDETCPYCVKLKNELEQQFGKDGDVRVIKMPSKFRPVAQQGIPQSMLLTLDAEGNWPRTATARVGAGVGDTYKAEIERLRQGQSPSNATESKPQPQVSQSPEVKPEENPSSEGNAEPTVEANHNNGGTGFQFTRTSDGKLARRSENEKGMGKVIRLFPDPDGKTRFAGVATPYGPTGVERLVPYEQKALRDYYLKNKETWKNLPVEQKKYIEEFLAGFGDEPTAIAKAEPEPKVLPKKETEKAEKPKKADSTQEQYRDILGARGISEVGTLSKDPSKKSFSKNGLRVDWMKDDLTGKSYRFVTNERTGQTILSGSSLEGPVGKPAAAKDFNVKDLIPAATKAGKIAAEFTVNQIFPGAGTAARVMGPKALEAMKALPGPNGFFGATPEKTVKNYNIDFFQSLKNGEKFQIDGVEYKATGPGKRTYSARSPAGPFGLEVPTEKGTVKIRIEGFGSARKVYVD